MRGRYEAGLLHIDLFSLSVYVYDPGSDLFLKLLLVELQDPIVVRCAHNLVVSSNQLIVFPDHLH